MIARPRAPSSRRTSRPSPSTTRCARWSGSAPRRAARTSARIVAVTGSVGKTSAKEMLRVALGRFGPTHASAASYNNHWGVPLTLARLPADAAFAAYSRSA